MLRRGLGLITVLIVVIFALSPALEVTAQDGSTYTVQQGDNLFRISLRFGLTVQELAAANGISDPNIIYVGQVLTIPSGGTTPVDPQPDPDPDPQPQPQPDPDTTGTYTVVAGDTLSKIARQFGTTYTAIAAANGIANPNIIYVGQVLVIPGGGGGTTPVPDDGGGSNPAPVVTPGAGGGFALGGHIQGFGRIAEMQSSGMNWAKKQIRWHRGDSTATAEQFINDAHGRGLKALVGSIGFPNEMGDFETYTDEYAAYLGQLASKGPDAIEVWNEPNLTREWPAGAVSGTNYTRMLAKAFNAIKAANPNVMVVSAAPAPTGFFGGCSGNGCDDINFIQQMRAAGATNYMDCIGMHYNEGIISPDQRSGDPRNPSNHYTRYFFGMLDTYYNAFGGARKVCITELGYLSPDGYGQLPAGFAWGQNTSVSEHAEWLGRAATLARSSGRVRLMIVWNVDFTGVFGDDPAGGYAIVRPDGSCPACSTLGAAMR